MEPNMIGAYGPWAAGLVGDGPARLSFRDSRRSSADLDAWRARARQRLRDCLLQPATGDDAQRRRFSISFEYDGLHVEHLSWQLPYGPPTEAVVLKPAGARGRLPGRARAFTITAATSTSAGARSPRSATSCTR